MTRDGPPPSPTVAGVLLEAGNIGERFGGRPRGSGGGSAAGGGEAAARGMHAAEDKRAELR